MKRIEEEKSNYKSQLDEVIGVTTNFFKRAVRCTRCDMGLHDLARFISYNIANKFNEDTDNVYVIDDDYVEYSFLTKYEEFGDLVQHNIVRVSRDLSSIAIKIGYGNINFYEGYKIESVRENNIEYYVAVKDDSLKKTSFVNNGFETNYSTRIKTR